MGSYYCFVENELALSSKQIGLIQPYIEKRTDVDSSTGLCEFDIEKFIKDFDIFGNGSKYCEYYLEVFGKPFESQSFKKEVINLFYLDENDTWYLSDESIGNAIKIIAIVLSTRLLVSPIIFKHVEDDGFSHFMDKKFILQGKLVKQETYYEKPISCPKKIEGVQYLDIEEYENKKKEHKERNDYDY